MGGVVRIAKGLFSGGTTSNGWKMPSNEGFVNTVVDMDKEAKDAAATAALPPPALVAAEEETKTLLKKKKKGRYNTILSGKEDSLGAANVERKSLLGN